MYNKNNKLKHRGSMALKVRISKDKTKELKFALELFEDDKWTINRRFKTRARAQDQIDHMYRNSDQLKDFVYEDKQ